MDMEHVGLSLKRLSWILQKRLSSSTFGIFFKIFDPGSKEVPGPPQRTLENFRCYFDTPLYDPASDGAATPHQVLGRGESRSMHY